MISSRKQPSVKLMKTLLRWLALGFLFAGTHAFAQTGGTVTYVYTDPQGTPLAEADASGNITATFDYTPYGTTALGTPPNGPGYTGHVNDPETNLVYMQARYYDPATGRFLSVDPVTPDEGNTSNFNRYAYASNNPIVNIDPDGMDACAGGQNGDSGSCPPPPPKQPTPQPQTMPAITVTATRVPDVYPEEIDIPAAPLALVRGVSGIGLFLMDANGVHDLIFGKQGCYGALTCDGSPNHYSKGKKIPKPGVSGKDGAKDVPSWAKGERPNIGESGKDFADRLFGKKYGGAPTDKGPGSEWSKIRKWGDRSFTDP